MADERSCARKSLPNAAPFSPRDVAAILFRQKHVGALSFAIFLTGALVYSIFATSYQAEMKILVRRARIDSPITAQETQAVDFSRDGVTEQELNSEADLLHDNEILREVVIKTGLDGSHGPLWSRNRDENIDRAVRRLARKLAIEPVHKTNIIGVKYESDDPKLAAQVLRVLADVYEQKHKDVQRPTGEFTFFEQQAAQYWQGLKSAQEDLLRFTETRRVVSADLERDMELHKLSDAEAAYRQVQVEIAANTQRIHSLRQQLASLPERSTTDVRTSDNPQLLERLKTTLLTLELKRTELLTKYQPTYRLVQEVETQIAQTRAAIAAENLAPVRDETTAKNPNFEWATAELEKAEVEKDALRARAAACAVVLASYQSSAQKLAADSIKQNNLVRTVKANEDRYLLYLRKQEEARIGDALDARGIVNVAVVQEPRTPALPRRSFALMAAVSIVSAFCVSVATAFAADYLDPCLRTPEEVKLYLATPVLASLPRRSA
jgi:uncharacterized protein involved in exopolysaccharide biosynthesis